MGLITPLIFDQTFLAAFVPVVDNDLVVKDPRENMLSGTYTQVKLGI